MALNVYNVVSKPESGGNPTIVNPTSTSSGNAAGLYQITSGTWADFAPRAGVSLVQYPTAPSAPTNVQTQVANTIPLNRWAKSTVDAVRQAYPGLNTDGLTLGEVAALTGSDPSQVVVNATPGQQFPAPAGTPSGAAPPPGWQSVYDSNGQWIGFEQTGQLSTSASTGTGASAAGAGQPGYLPPSQSGGPAATGITPGLAAGITGWITDIETKTGNAFSGAVSSVEAGVLNAFKGALSSVENWTIRGFLILIGVVIIAIALWKLFDPDGSKAKAAAEHLAVAA